MSATNQTAQSIDGGHIRNCVLSRRQTFIFVVTCALAVANVYFAQPLLQSMADSLSVPSATIGVIVTATQAGYALGLVFIVPLGDLLNRNRLIIGQMLLCAVALGAVGLAQTWGLLLAAMLLVGLMAVLVQVIVAYAATLASPEQRGEVVGSVTSGVVLGILLARLVSGVLAQCLLRLSADDVGDGRGAVANPA